MIENVNLCKCNNCNTILLDQNPQIGAKLHSVNLNKVEVMQYIKDEDSQDQSYFWGCPICMNDDYLTDELTDEEIKQLK